MEQRPAERNYYFEQQLCLAVQQRRTVRLRYEHDVHYRWFEPYVVYRDPQGRVLVGGIRTRDEKGLHKTPGPRRFEVGSITDLQLTEEHFEVDPRFNADKEEFTRDALCSVVRRP